MTAGTGERRLDLSGLGELARRVVLRGRGEPVAALHIAVVAAHPDDPEEGVGGLIARLSQAGHQVSVAYLTTHRGGRQVDERPEDAVRRAEAAAAMALLGGQPYFFPYAHETLQADAPTVAAVRGWLSGLQPDVVLTHWPIDGHLNHHVTSSLVWQCYDREAGWNLYFFELATPGETLGFVPNAYVDVTDLVELKEQALGRHVSQAPETLWPLALELLARRGQECEVRYAEALHLVHAKPGSALLPCTLAGVPATG